MNRSSIRLDNAMTKSISEVTAPMKFPIHLQLKLLSTTVQLPPLRQGFLSQGSLSSSSSLRHSSMDLAPLLTVVVFVGQGVQFN